MKESATPSFVFSSNLKRLRFQAEITQEMLAEKSDLHWRYLQKLESGSANPSLKVLFAVKRALRCRWDDLLGR
ncbi:MAG: helix-turn-helix domain-containing protein [Methylacidiphilales bacterium]|nr:helix-turn-helix domain-containing protein [Candidatus Methylacidiphilales bacterium]